MAKLGTSDGARPADTALESIVSDIKNGGITEPKVARGRFSTVFDNLLLTYARTTPAAYNKVMSFWQRSCHFLVEQDRAAKEIRHDADQRADAYRMAVGQLSVKVRQRDFSFSKGASILLRDIYQKECINMRRRESGKQVSEMESRISYGSNLPFDVASKLHPPTELLYYDLQRLREAAPDCYRLYRQLIEIGYQYNELENLLNRKANNLMNDKYKCGKKLRAAYRALTR